MKKLFFIGVLFSSFSVLMCADSEDTCLYEGTGITVQDVLKVENAHLSTLLQGAAQAYYSRPLISEVNIDYLPEGSLLKERLQKRNEFVRNIPEALNGELYQNVGEINHHFKGQICLCSGCKALLEKDSSLLEARHELYQAFQDALGDEDCNQESGFLVVKLRKRLPGESFWSQLIDKSVQEDNATKSMIRTTSGEVLSILSPRFNDPFEKALK